MSIAVTAGQPPTPVYGVNWGLVTGPGALVAGGQGTVTVNASNTGSLVWLANDPTHPMHLAYHWLNSSGAQVVWDGNRTILSQDISNSGQIVNRTMIVQAPPDAGQYSLVIDLVQEGVTWFAWKGVTPYSVVVIVQ